MKSLALFFTTILLFQLSQGQEPPKTNLIHATSDLTETEERFFSEPSTAERKSLNKAQVKIIHKNSFLFDTKAERYFRKTRRWTRKSLRKIKKSDKNLAYFDRELGLMQEAVANMFETIAACELEDHPEKSAEVASLLGYFQDLNSYFELVYQEWSAHFVPSIGQKILRKQAQLSTLIDKRSDCLTSGSYAPYSKIEAIDRQIKKVFIEVEGLCKDSLQIATDASVNYRIIDFTQELLPIVFNQVELKYPNQPTQQEILKRHFTAHLHSLQETYGQGLIDAKDANERSVLALEDRIDHAEEQIRKLEAQHRIQKRIQKDLKSRPEQVDLSEKTFAGL